ncbi:murein L,D-transpeptidase catalytic domain family protein [Stenotrophomonas maltophilia]|nr:murein L,D-transpeptidase catalytic domain family protein [Stenotrophomonas maltophilia]
MITRAVLIAMLMVGGYAQAGVPQHIEGMSRTTRAHAEQALDCSRKLGRDPTLLIVADMRLPSSAQRLWAIDPRTSEVVLRTEVAHGRGSDPDRSGRASVFSNTPGSLMTSVGLYAVSEAYRNTKDGSTRRRLDGLMVGFNDAARERAVVLHPASYVRAGWAGHSEGCPAVSYAVMDQLNERGLDNAVLWIEGDQAGLAEAIASCSGSKVRHRFRWPWQPKLPAKPVWKPEASDALNPLFDIRAEGFCPVRTDLVWFSQEAPMFASQVGERWPLTKWY